MKHPIGIALGMARVLAATASPASADDLAVTMRKVTPESTGALGDGHLGDLPLTEVNASGIAKLSVTAPRIKDGEMHRKRSLIVQTGGDSYSDAPARDGDVVDVSPAA